MSATKQKQKPASGSLRLQIKVNAEWVGKDAQAMARLMFACELETISEQQAMEMLRNLAPLMEAKHAELYAARTPQSGPHSHPCITCGGLVDCRRESCRETASEHSYCHEGMTASEWLTYHRKLEQGY
jgi:hypothetical protein